MATAPNRPALRPLVWAVLAGVPLAQAETDLQFSMDAGVGNTDNILRSPDNERSEDMAALGAQLSLRQQTRRFSADLLGDLTYAHYGNDTYDSEVIGNFIGAMKAALLPERITWVVEDNFGQSVPDPLVAVTPDNQENVNVFATGPDFYLPLGSANHAGLSARYMRTDFEESPFSNDRFSTMLYFGRELGSSAVVSLRASTERVTPEDASGSAEYDLTEVYGRYEIEGSRSTLTVEAGGTRVERGPFSDDGPLVRLSMSRELTTRSTLRLSLGREYSDAGRALRFEQGIGGIDTATSAVASNSEPFVAESAALEWSATGRRTRVGLGASYVDEQYPQQPLSDRSRLIIGGRISRDFGPRLSFDLGASYSDDDVAVDAGDAAETMLGAGFSWRAGRTIFLDLRYERVERSADNPLNEFTEQRAWLRLRYGAEPSRRVPAVRDAD